jgi:putative tricarboxylic transport membrane protein
MDVIQNVIYGFEICLQPINLVYCFFGTLIGTLVGVLPGLGPAAAIALLLPSTFHASPVSATIMLAGIYYGAMYGGSTTSILVNIPGEAASVVTCMDGYQMALRGRAGPALGIAACGSFIAGTFGVIALTLIGPFLTGIAIKFGPPEYFALMLVGIMILTFLGSGSMVKSLMMAAVGLFLSGIGMDTISGKYRFTQDVQLLLDGVGLVPMTMGLFGISEVLLNLEAKINREIFATRIKNLWPTLKDWADSIKSILRGTVLGFFLGILPGQFWLPSPPMPSRRSSPNTLKSLERGPFKGWQGLNRQTTREPSGPLSLFLPSEYPPIPSWPFYWEPWLCTDCSRDRS